MRGGINMVTNKAIHQFAKKFLEKFQSENIISKELSAQFIDECECLGFKINDKRYFKEFFTDLAVFDKYEILDKEIDLLSNINVIGTMILTKYNEICEPNRPVSLTIQEKTWFIIAFLRLVYLTTESGDKSSLFEGEVIKISMISNNMCVGESLCPEDEVEQHLILTEDGRVWFNSFTYGDDDEYYVRNRTINLQMNKQRTKKVLQVLETYFHQTAEHELVSDKGQWELSITNHEGEIFKYKGSLLGNMKVNGIELSDHIRSLIDIEKLFLFDGDSSNDRIEQISIKYWKHIIREDYSDVIVQFLADYDEEIIINRSNYSLQHSKSAGWTMNISKDYMSDTIPAFLDKFDPNKLFTYVEGNPEDTVEETEALLNYHITVDYKERPQYIVNGSFDQKGLPYDFDIFISKLKQFMATLDFGELFDSRKYNKIRRRVSEYIYCSVEFYSGGNYYYYLTDDATIEEGDMVYVLAGNDERLEVVEVVNVEYFLEEEVPYPLHKTKKIIRKLTSEDWDEYKNDVWRDY